MKFTVINEHPKDAKEYLEAAHFDNPNAYFSSLQALLASHPSPIVAVDIPIDWAMRVEDFAIANNFEIKIVPSVVNPSNPEIGTAFGTFYYKKVKPDRTL